MTAKSATARVKRARAAVHTPTRRAKRAIASAPPNGRDTWPTLLIAGGVLGAAALVALSPAVWARVGSVIFGTGARLARWSLAPALVGTVLTRVGTAAEQGGQALRRAAQVPTTH
jgi:hypothetical protein